MVAETKGAPARESCTGTRLVSPASGCKKKRPLCNKASKCRIEYIRSIFSIHRCYREWYSSWKSSRTRKRVKETCCWMAFHIWTNFFLCHHATNPSSLAKYIWLKKWTLIKRYLSQLQVLGIKANIDNLIQTALLVPVLDMPSVQIVIPMSIVVQLALLTLRNAIMGRKSVGLSAKGFHAKLQTHCGVILNSSSKEVLECKQAGCETLSQWVSISYSDCWFNFWLTFYITFSA